MSSTICPHCGRRYSSPSIATSPLTTGRLDGVPEPPLPEPWADFNRKGDRGQAEQALTLEDIRRARNA